MPTLHASSVFNVQASLNAWLQTTLAAITRPAWLASYTLIFNEPEAPLSVPAFGVTHRLRDQRAPWQGLNPGARAQGVMAISAWVSRGPSWNAQLDTMQAMVEQAAASASSLVISDYQSSLTAPAPTVYKIDLLRLEAFDSARPANPDLERRMFALGYAWVVRE